MRHYSNNIACAYKSPMAQPDMHVPVRLGIEANTLYAALN